MRQFLNFKILPTRDIRENLLYIRKRVYYLHLFNKEFVIIYFSKKYINLYYKYLYAFNYCYLEKEFKLLFKIPFLRLVIIPFIKGDLSKDSKAKKEIIQICSSIQELNLRNNHVSKIELRYIKELSKLLGKSASIKYEHFKNNIALIANLSLTSQVGFGIDDPVLTNFRKYELKYYIVDLDNFSKNVNYSYEIGYLIGDLEIDYKLKIKYNDIFRRIKYLDTKLFYLGILSRYSNLIINQINNPTQNYKYKLNYSIMKMGKILDRVLPII